MSFSVLHPNALLETEFDRVIIATHTGFNEVAAQLAAQGIAPHKIDGSYTEHNIWARKAFLTNFAMLAKERNLEGACAEVGVYRGDFARHINALFPTKKLYLFDTFEGFAAVDLQNESKEAQNLGAGHFANTSVELVLSKMPYVAQCIVKKGWFPETTEGLEDERFCFVSLDTDLHDPILAGLEFFYPRMVNGGAILVDDYFSTYDGRMPTAREWAQILVDDYFSTYDGVKKAVDCFAAKMRMFAMPIGDNGGVILVKGG
ncbi:MAG: TylF/MycF family methyltransferase [Helicobacter sp.]|nr:TylF/MycF family methyltransferase [Helicobacter sp.]